jgi:hypothetical protein
VDLRCYGLATPRNDGKLSVHFNDIDNFYHEWDLDTLPWDAVTPVLAGAEHPEVLDQKLIDAISAGPLKGIDENRKSAQAASLAFLYLYLVLASGGERYVEDHRRGPHSPHPLIVDCLSISPRDQHSLSVQASALLLHSLHAQHQRCCCSNDGSVYPYLRPLRLLQATFTPRIKADELSRRQWRKKSTDGHSWRRKFSTAIRVV